MVNAKNLYYLLSMMFGTGAFVAFYSLLQAVH